MNILIDKVGDREAHVLAGLLDVVSVFVSEEQNVEIPTASPAAVLNFSWSQESCGKSI